MAAIAALTSCNSTSNVQRAGGTTMWVAPSESEFYMTAGLLGTLGKTASGCLASVPRTSGLAGAIEPTPLQFPYGSTLAEDGQSVEIPGLGILHLGDEISGGGGSMPGQNDAIPQECRAESVIFWQTVG